MQVTGTQIKSSKSKEEKTSRITWVNWRNCRRIRSIPRMPESRTADNWVSLSLPYSSTISLSSLWASVSFPQVSPLPEMWPTRSSGAVSNRQKLWLLTSIVRKIMIGSAWWLVLLEPQGWSRCCDWQALQTTGGGSSSFLRGRLKLLHEGQKSRWARKINRSPLFQPCWQWF